MKKFISLKKFVSVPGSTQTEIIKNFCTEEKAVEWLKGSGYKKISDRWENKDEQEDGIFEVWVYIKIIKQKFDSSFKWNSEI
jgi:hypothetical protein